MPLGPSDLTGRDRTWQQAVVASREAAKRDRDVALRARDRYRHAVEKAFAALTDRDLEDRLARVRAGVVLQDVVRDG